MLLQPNLQYLSRVNRLQVIYSIAIPLLITVMVGACVPADDKQVEYPFALDVHKPDQQRVLDLQDRQEVDSIARYFTHPDPSLRYRAAMAIGSIRDSTIVHSLGKLLEDEVPEVRYAAAFALGQTGASQAEDILINGFDPYDSLRQYSQSNAAILEAVGKTGSVRSLHFLSTIESYKAVDSVLILGQARGIYRFALRGLVIPEGTDAMVDLLESTHLPRSIRLMAANYLFRAQRIDTKQFLQSLIPLFASENDPEIRMCLATAIGKSGDPGALQTLNSRFRRETDYRVKCNIARAWRFFRYSDVHDIAMQSVRDENLHVARTVSEYIVDKGSSGFALDYRTTARGQLPWEVKALLYQAANKYLRRSYAITKGNLQNELSIWFDRTKNPYERAAVLRAIGAEETDYNKVHELGYPDDHPVVRTTAVSILAGITQDEELNARVGAEMARSIRTGVVALLLEAINSGDVAMIAEAAPGLAAAQVRDQARPLVPRLKEVLNTLEMPEGIETYNALQACIASIESTKPMPRETGFNHPIDWALVNQLRDTVSSEIVTSRGSILIELYTDKAPGTVANFVKLSRDRFYHGKKFHRVVPNFVIQGGCPRGDGYGSADYTIRSELIPLYYDTHGCIGMASAGNHTESTQWFITHSPTPHLDGNYTLFGKVRSGMAVVHEIQPGDEIREVNIIN